MNGSGHENSKNVQLVKVYIRPRPFTKQELELKRPNVIQQETLHEISLKCGIVEKKYTFDRVFASNTSQAEVYDTVVFPSIEFVLSGYTCTVFAYGQTGTGKTYTMTGPDIVSDIDLDPSTGMIPRAATHIFTRLNELNLEHTVTVSFIEIYNEEVRDLLVKDGPPLRIYDDSDNKGATCVKGLSENKASNLGEVYDLLNIGATERQIASTNLNRNSSRSHTIFTLIVNTREVTPDGEEIIKTGKLHLIDLAGSENIERSGATEMRAREAGTINKSLLTLGKVIKALALKMQHVPYRESKLTRILQDSLGGKSKTCMIATFSPVVDAFDETVSTLDYAHFARSVANCPTVNINKNHTNVWKVSQNEVVKLRQELNATRTGEGFYMSSASYEKINFDIKTKNERVIYLVKKIQELEEHNREKKQVYDELNDSFEKVSSNVETITKELEEQSIKERQNRYVKEYMKGTILTTNEMAKTLLNVCNSSTKHEDIYHKKYENQLNTSLRNAGMARNICAATITSLKEIQHSFDIFLKNEEDSLINANASVTGIKENQLKNLDRFDRLSEEMQTKYDSYNPSFDSLFRHSSFSRDKVHETSETIFVVYHKTQLERLDQIKTTLNSVKNLVSENRTVVESQAQQRQNLIQEMGSKDVEYCINVDNLLDDVVKSLQQKYTIVEEKIANMRKFGEVHTYFLELASARVESTKQSLECAEQICNTVDDIIRIQAENNFKYLEDIKEALVTFNECLKPLKSEETSLESVVNIIEESQRICREENEAFQETTQKYFEEFFNTLEKEIDHHNKELESTFTTWSRECASVHEDLVNSSVEHSRIIQDNIGKFLDVQKTYTSDVKQFIQNSLETIDHLGKNIENKIHDGDTPVKPVYTYPKTFERNISEEVLREQFNKIMLQQDSPLNYTCE